MSLPRSNWADCQPMSPALGVSCSAPERAEASEGLEGSPMLAATKTTRILRKMFRSRTLESDSSTYEVIFAFLRKVSPWNANHLNCDFEI